VSTTEQRRLPLLVSYRLFVALLPLALDGDAVFRRDIVRELKVALLKLTLLDICPTPALSFCLDVEDNGGLRKEGIRGCGANVGLAD
jgi:hypothetical protein